VLTKRSFFSTFIIDLILCVVISMIGITLSHYIVDLMLYERHVHYFAKYYPPFLLLLAQCLISFLLLFFYLKIFQTYHLRLGVFLSQGLVFFYLYKQNNFITFLQQSIIYLVLFCLVFWWSNRKVLQNVQV